MRWLVALLLVIMCGCAQTNKENLSSIQLIDRNGFSETISVKERLATYQKEHFLEPQPYTKVVRHFGKKSIITSYHDNGLIAEYLEIIGGRAQGKYFEWHQNGQVKVEVILIEGLGELSSDAKESWIFDGTSRVYSESGNLLVEMSYDKGLLSGESRYYDADGNLVKTEPYQNGELDGAVIAYSNEGEVVGKQHYIYGLRDGVSYFDGDKNAPRRDEEYAGGKLHCGYYYDFEGALIAYVEDGKGECTHFKDGNLLSITEIRCGKPEGEVKTFDTNGSLSTHYFIKGEKKHGKETIYYPDSLHEKLSLEWRDGLLQGTVKTWYESGVKESERELYKNKRHGLSLCWYLDGSVMHIEEYENDTLVKGTYFEKGEKEPITRVERGAGVATLFDEEGYLKERVTYEHGVPLAR